MKENTNTKEFTIIKDMREDVKLGLYINMGEKSYKIKPIHFEQLEIQCNLPRNNMSNIIMRVYWTSYNDISAHIYLPYMIVGGIVHVDLFNYPAKAKKAKSKIEFIILGWVIRQVFDLENTLKQIHYPDSSRK